MMLAGTLLFAAAQAGQTPPDEKDVDAKALLRRTMQQVQRAKSFDAIIEHHDSNESYPGEFIVRLRWKGGVGFDIVAIERGTGGSSLPNYYSRGKTVTSVYRDMRRMTESTTPRPFITPGWEVLGGLNFTFLAKSSLAEFMFSEPKPGPKLNLPPDAKVPEPPSMSYTLGERREFRGHSVREIIAKAGDADLRPLSIFVHPTSRYVIGIETTYEDGRTGWLYYREINVNGDMPSDLGLAPGG